ncbi:MAG: twin-arginine translocation signal domain-containing protein, partial [Gemmatimonadales bacterium]
MLDRREFIQTTAGAAVAATLPVRLPQADASARDICMRALNAAKAAGASYADVRVARTRRQSVSTREQQITNL